MKTFTQFWADERGFVVSSELVLIATIVVIGLVTGLTTVRDQVVTEMGDVGGSVGRLVQSYSYSGVSAHSSSAAGTSFNDRRDFCSGVVKDDLGFEISSSNTVVPGVQVAGGE